VLKKYCAIVIAACVFSAAAFAEQVSLKNGDHLSGAIVSMDGKKLVIKTTYAGEVSIDWAEVSQFSSDKDTLVVTKADKQVVSGTVTSQDSNVLVATAAGVQTVPRTCVHPPIRLRTRNRYIRDCSKAGLAAAILVSPLHEEIAKPRTSRWASMPIERLLTTNG